MASKLLFLIDSNNVFVIPSLVNGLTDAVVTGATVTATVYDESGNEIAGETWPILLSESETVPGQYFGTMSADAVMNNKQKLHARIVADAGTGLKRTWCLNGVAKCSAD